MTNEELMVLAGLAKELIESRKQANTYRTQRDVCIVESGKHDDEYKLRLDECNRLRESEANALNAAEEAKRERDEARKKMRDYTRFFYCTIYTALVRAIEMKDIRKIVKDAVKVMRDFIYEHPIDFNEGEKAK